MNAKELYSKQVNAFCEDNCKLTAADILAQVLNRTNDPDAATPSDTVGKTESNITPIKGKKKIFRLGHMAAACIISFLLIGTTLAATSKYWGDFTKNTKGDEKTSEIVEKGYTYEVQESLINERFSAVLLGFTGDKNEPKVLFDIFINDPSISTDAKTVGIKVYTLGVEQFENELDHYGYNIAYGVQDEENEDLYHFSFTGTPVWLGGGSEAVVQIFEIFLTDNEGAVQTYDVNFEYRVTIPLDSFHPVHSINPIVDFTYEDITYSLNGIEFGYYETWVALFSDTIVQNPPNDSEELNSASLNMRRNWKAVVSSATMIVDGTEYQLLEESGYSNVWFDTQAEAGTQYRCYMHLFFPDIDYSGANEIILILGGNEIKLK